MRGTHPGLAGYNGQGRADVPRDQRKEWSKDEENPNAERCPNCGRIGEAWEETNGPVREVGCPECGYAVEPEEVV